MCVSFHGLVAFLLYLQAPVFPLNFAFGEGVHIQIACTLQKCQRWQTKGGQTEKVS